MNHILKRWISTQYLNSNKIYRNEVFCVVYVIRYTWWGCSIFGWPSTKCREHTYTLHKITFSVFDMDFTNENARKCLDQIHWRYLLSPCCVPVGHKLSDAANLAKFIYSLDLSSVLEMWKTLCLPYRHITPFPWISMASLTSTILPGFRILDINSVWVPSPPEVLMVKKLGNSV